jgi:hypothetical protein
MRQSSPSWERGPLRSRVEREARAHVVNSRRRFAKPFKSSVSRSTPLRVVPLSRDGED